MSNQQKQLLAELVKGKPENQRKWTLLIDTIFNPASGVVQSFLDTVDISWDRDFRTMLIGPSVESFIGTGSITTTASTTITGTGTKFLKELKVGDLITLDHTTYLEIHVIATIVSDTEFTVSEAMWFSDTYADWEVHTPTCLYVGSENTVTNSALFVIGRENTVSGYPSIAIGQYNTVVKGSIAIGSENLIEDENRGIAIGGWNKVTSRDACVIGIYNEVLGSQAQGSYIFGNYSTVTGGVSQLILGFQSESTTSGGIVVGNSCKSNAQNAVVIGSGVNTTTLLTNSTASTILFGVASITPSMIIFGAGVATYGGNVGIGTILPASRMTVEGGDIEVTTDLKGVILRSPDGTRYRVTVPDGGATLTITSL